MMFPNLRDQSNPTDLENEVLEILFRYNCSNALLVLLCSVCVPFCGSNSANNIPFVVQPCHNLCQHVFGGCILVFREFCGPLSSSVINFLIQAMGGYNILVPLESLKIHQIFFIQIFLVLMLLFLCQYRIHQIHLCQCH